MSYKMPLDEAKNRIRTIADYNAYHLREEQPHHCVTQAQVEQTIRSWGHDPALGRGIGIQRPPSPFLAKLTEGAGTMVPASGDRI